MSSIRDFFPVEYRVGGTKPKKNFLLENKKYVTKLGKMNQMSKENENPLNNVQKLKLRPGTRKDYIHENLKNEVKTTDLDRIDASIKSIRSLLAQTKITQEKLDVKNRGRVGLGFKDEATQTVNPYDENDILKDSIIRYSKSRNSDKIKIIQKKNMNSISVQTDCLESENVDTVSRKDFKSIQQEDVSSKKPNEKKLNLVKFQKNALDHHQPGEIPKYLKDRKALKEKNDKETQKKLAIRRELGLDDPACPPGHILLPELERLDHLAKIKKDYSRLVMELNMLPVSSDSYKMKEKRKHLEKELDKLQLGIKLFSREKLYVKINPKITNSY